MLKREAERKRKISYINDNELTLNLKNIQTRKNTFIPLI